MGRSTGLADSGAGVVKSATSWAVSGSPEGRAPESAACSSSPDEEPCSPSCPPAEGLFLMTIFLRTWATAASSACFVFFISMACLCAGLWPSVWIILSTLARVSAGIGSVTARFCAPALWTYLSTSVACILYFFESSETVINIPFIPS